MFREFVRRGGWLVILPALVIAVALNSAAQSRAAAARLAAEGVDAEATISEKIEQRRFVPGVRSKYTEPERVLKFRYSSGSVLRGDFHVGIGEARVSEAFFAGVEVGASVPLRYLRDDDSVFELEPGSLQAEADNAVGVAAVIGVICVPLFVIVALGARRRAKAAAALPG